MKIPTPPQTPVADWIQYLTHEYGYDQISRDNAKFLYQALQRAQHDLGAILGHDYDGLKLTHRSGQLLLREMISTGIRSQIGVSLAILKRLRDYADRQILDLQPNLLNNYGSTNPRKHRKKTAAQRVHAA